MKLPIALLFSIFCGFLQAKEEIISKAKNRDAEVVGISEEPGGVNSIRLLAKKRVLWEPALAWGYPSSVIVSWSPGSTKVAISIRTTKTSSEIHVFDLFDKQQELRIPDFVNLTLALNSQIRGRFLHIVPLGWADEDTIILSSQGNLVDGLSDGSTTLNFQYQITLHLPTQRVLSVTCLSHHDLNGLGAKVKPANNP